MALDRRLIELPWPDLPRSRVGVRRVQGLRNFWNFADGSGTCLITGAALTPPANASAMVWRPGGLELDVSSWSTTAATLPLAWDAGGGPITILVGLRHLAGTVDLALMNPNWDGFYVQTGSSALSTNNSDFSGSVSPAAGVWHGAHLYSRWAITFGGANDLRACINGGSVSSDTSCAAPTPTAPNSTLRLGADADGANRADLIVHYVAIFDRSMINDELRWYGRNVEDLFEPAFLPMPTGAAGGGTSIAPGIGAAAAAGASVAIATGTSIAPAVGNGVAAGSTAAVAVGISIAPGVGTASASGAPVALAIGTSIAPGVGAAVAAGAAAAITVGTGTTITPGVGAAVAAGSTAAVSAGTAILPSVGVASAAGVQVAVAVHTAVGAGVGLATAAGAAASIAVGTSIAPGVGAASAAGLPASITASTPTSISPGVGTAVAAGLSVSIVIGGSVTTVIGLSVGQAVATGYDCSVYTGVPAALLARTRVGSGRASRRGGARGTITNGGPR